MLRKLSRVSLCMLLVFAFGVTVSVSDDWPMFHHDLALSGVSSSAAPNTNQIAWVYDTGSPVYSSPAVMGGILYVGGTDGNLYAVDAYTGSLIWAYNTGSQIHSSPAVENGIVYVLSENGNFYAFNAVTGLPIWSVGIGDGSWDWSSPAVHAGNVFISSSTGFVYSLNAATGTINWSTNLGASPNSPITVVNGKVYAGTHNFDGLSPTLVALDEATGAIVWQYDHHLWPLVTPRGTVGMINCNGVAVVDGDGDGDLEVYFGLYLWSGGPSGTEAVCLDEATGAEVWTQNLNGNSTSTPAVHNGVVFIGSDDNNLYALDAATGAINWTYLTGGAVYAAPAVADGKVFVGSLDHTFYALDEATGALVWSYYTGASRLESSPAVAYGNVYVGNENGKIYAFGGPVEVVFDIKPASCPSSVNIDASGVTPFAIAGTPDFDVTMVDPTSLVLIGPEGQLTPPIKSEIKDGTQPPEEGEPCFQGEPYTDTDGDGVYDAYDEIPDLFFYFYTEDVAGILPDGLVHGDEVILALAGNLISGDQIEGEDVMLIRMKGKKPKPAPATGSVTSILDAYPMPFNPDVWMPYRLGRDVVVKITVHDAMGRLVRTLDLGYRPAGDYVSKDRAAYWDGRNEAGELTSSGIYFYTFQAGDFAATKKLVMLK